MARLETQLKRTYHQIEKMMEEGSDASKITYFYSLVHCYEKLNDRYIKAYGHSFNPCRESSVADVGVRRLEGYTHD
jgi:hypothetical protein